MSDSLQPQHLSHPRTFQTFRFAYPVVSRRSKGVSLGINLNPDKICNFDCVYCQVDRRSEAETKFVEMDALLSEVDAMLSRIVSGELYSDPKFAETPEHLRRLDDLAFSGDGEPTTYRNFDEIVARVAELKRKHGLTHTKMVLITNASMFHRETVKRGLEILDQNQGEIWAKLDAGTSEYYHLIERTTIPFQRILDNILDAARVRPLVIQSLFMRVHGERPSHEEIDAFCGRLNDIIAGGGALSLIQIYTIARIPAEDWVSALSQSELDEITNRVLAQTGLTVESFAGRETPRSE